MKPGTRGAARPYRRGMRRLLALVPALVLAVLPPAVAPAQAAGKDVYFHNLGGEGEKEPPLIHTAFNSSPYYTDLTWSGWGTKKAKGTGVLDNTCGACWGQEVIDAVLTFKRFKTCKDGSLIYRRARARLTYEDGTSASTRVPNVCATDYS